MTSARKIVKVCKDIANELREFECEICHVKWPDCKCHDRETRLNNLIRIKLSEKGFK